jgi:hypothetical protein
MILETFYIYKEKYKIEMEPILTFVDEPVYMRDDCVDKLADDIHDFYIDTDTHSEPKSEQSPGTGTGTRAYTYCVLSIDIGVLHLGISVTTLDEEFNMVEIIWIDLINITEFIHKRGPNKKDCKLHHTKTFCDWLNHTYQENIDYFEMADFILVERQPPMGFVVIEQLIFSRWRDKTILISPNSMHKYFNIGCYDYEQRKVYTEKIARMKIENKRLLEQLEYYDRAHDIADSICIMVYWINLKHKEYQKEKRRKEIMQRQVVFNNKKKNGTLTIDELFESWRYVPRV